MLVLKQVFMNEIDFRQLIEGHVTGSLSDADQKKFFELLEKEEYRRILEQVMGNEWTEGMYEEQGGAQVYDRIERNVLSAIEAAPAKKSSGLVFFIRRYGLAAAAVLILAIAGIVFFLLPKGSKTTEPAVALKTQPAVKDIPPGKNGAILTLDNGQQIILDSVGNGIIADQGNSKIVKQQNGLSYETVNPANATVYNTISTPRGRQYPNLVLSDGTKVWLDAGSSIRFPVAFTGNERKVEITGQVWFDVVHNDRMPFKVMAKGTEITDVGTQFNVNAYADEASLKVTLLHGAVQVKGTILKPNEQATISEDGSLRLNKDVDIEEVMAWKNGLFKFDDADIQTVMKQLSRWYDVDVSYSGTITKETFSGKISKNLSLQDVLDGLAFTNVKFKIEGKKLIILP